MIPVHQPLLNGREKELLNNCIDSGWISSEGPYVKKFEEKFSAYIGTRYGVAVCSGTAALETALYAAGIERGDQIILPSFTIISCALAILRLGAEPVLVDVEPETWNMDVSQVKTRISDRTKAIMPVHIYGHPVEMDPLLKIAKDNHLVVIEDAAEVHGAEYKGHKCGSLGHISAWSFYANKIITTGEGGMVLTSDPIMAERAKSYRNLCFRPEKRFYHTEMGYNFRLTNLQAAVGLAQIERIEDFIETKRRLGAYYREKLADINGVKCQIEKPWAKSVYWMYCIELTREANMNAQTLMKELAKRGIGSRPFFLGLHEQPVLKEYGLFSGEVYPITERISRQGLYLPSSLNLTEGEIDEIVEAIKEIIQRSERSVMTVESLEAPKHGKNRKSTTINNYMH